MFREAGSVVWLYLNYGRFGRFSLAGAVLALLIRFDDLNDFELDSHGL